MDFLKRIFGKGKSQESVLLLDVTVVIGNGFTPRDNQIGELLGRGYLQPGTDIKKAQAQWDTLVGEEKAAEIGMRVAKEVVGKTIRKHGYTLEDLPSMRISINSGKLLSGAEFLILYFPLMRASEELLAKQDLQELFG